MSGSGERRGRGPGKTGLQPKVWETENVVARADLGIDVGATPWTQTARLAGVTPHPRDISIIDCVYVRRCKELGLNDYESEAARHQAAQGLIADASQNVTRRGRQPSGRSWGAVAFAV
eukprot:2664318-Pyramimonas_sp.AAC.1